MNKTIEQLHSHRSIRKYKQQEVSDDVLSTILEASTAASTSGNMQAYSIVVTRDKNMKSKMMEAHFNQSMLMDAPVFLTFCADFNRMRRWLQESDAANNFDNFMSFMIGSIDAILASQNAAIAAESLGLGVCYMGTTLASASEIGKVLELPENVIPVVGFSLGYPDEQPEERRRLPLDAIVHKEKYRDYSSEQIKQIYQKKETEGMERYRSHKELAKLIEESDVKNLAQVYTQVKYTEESHVKYSESLTEYLRSQNFLQQ
jgi:nitroreductase